MRRSPLVLATTIAGTAGVLAFHAHAPTVQQTAAAVSTSAPSKPSSTTTVTGASSGGGVSGTATGNAVATPYGDAQVRVTVKDGKIVTIEALQLQGNDPRSVAISSYAAPILKQEALTKQSAAVDAVSGATYTSASYAQSLQSALDKLGYKAPDGSVATLQVP
jgi:uncharacterized protein with FMN-binding domain